MAGYHSFIGYPWILDSLAKYGSSVVKQKPVPGQVVEFLRMPDCLASAADCQYPEAVVNISDQKYYIRAVITKEAQQMLESEDDHFTLADIKNKIIILKKFFVCFFAVEDVRECEFYLTVQHFSVLPMETNRVDLLNCNMDPGVRKKIKELWQNHITELEENDSSHDMNLSDVSLTQLLMVASEEKFSALKSAAEECLDFDPFDSQDDPPQCRTFWSTERRNQENTERFVIPVNLLLIPPHEEAILEQITEFRHEGQCTNELADSDEDGSSQPYSTALSTFSEEPVDEGPGQSGNPWNKLQSICVSIATSSDSQPKGSSSVNSVKIGSDPDSSTPDISLVDSPDGVNRISPLMFSENSSNAQRPSTSFQESDNGRPGTSIQESHSARPSTSIHESDNDQHSTSIQEGQSARHNTSIQEGHSARPSISIHESDNCRPSTSIHESVRARPSTSIHESDHARPSTSIHESDSAHSNTNSNHRQARSINTSVSSLNLIPLTQDSQPRRLSVSSKGQISPLKFLFSGIKSSPSHKGDLFSLSDESNREKYCSPRTRKATKRKKTCEDLECTLPDLDELEPDYVPGTGSSIEEIDKVPDSNNGLQTVEAEVPEQCNRKTEQCINTRENHKSSRKGKQAYKPRLQFVVNPKILTTKDPVNEQLTSKGPAPSKVCTQGAPTNATHRQPSYQAKEKSILHIFEVESTKLTHPDGTAFQYKYKPPPEELCASVKAIQIPADLCEWAVKMLSDHQDKLQ